MRRKINKLKQNKDVQAGLISGETKCINDSLSYIEENDDESNALALLLYVEEMETDSADL